MSTAVIIQSNYIPWKGYFDLIAAADVLILYDDVQYTKNDWRNRNRIKTAQGPKWLTIPIATSGHFSQRIDEAQTSNDLWAERHWRSIKQAYNKAPAFDEHAETFENIYRSLCAEKYLSVINRTFIDAICCVLGIRLDVHRSQDLVPPSDLGVTQRLVQLCQSVGANRYLSGPSASGYIESKLFERGGIELDFMDYAGYPPYAQLHGEFVHDVSVLDLIFTVGEDADRFMKFRRKSCDHG